MTNIERQKSLDKKKYLFSEKHKQDCSGVMTYCFYCKHQKDNCTCNINHQMRVSLSSCATAYNKMYREINK